MKSLQKYKKANYKYSTNPPPHQFRHKKNNTNQSNVKFIQY